MTEGARLERLRNALPRVQKGPISAKSLSAMLDWEPTRWWNLEQKEAWGPFQREEVAAGVRAIVERLDVDAAAIEACVAFVLDGAQEPELGPWREGMAPPARKGRPKGTGRALRRPRVLPRDDDEPDGPPRARAARPIFSDSVRRMQIDEILIALESGKVSRDSARETILDLYSFYNKSPGQGCA